MEKDKQDFIEKWIDNNPKLLLLGLSATLLTYGTLMIIGAIKDWNWLYEPDSQYSANPARKAYPRKVSYTYGRKIGRIYGFFWGRFFFLPLGLFLAYIGFLEKQR